MKQAEDGNGMIVRLWNPRPGKVFFEADIHCLNVTFKGELGGYQFAGYRITEDKRVIRVNLMEEEREDGKI